MLLLILGLALWSGAHLFKRLAPEARAKIGDPGKGAVALLSLTAIVLMVLGYRAAEGAVFWGRSPATVGINNLLMIGALFLFSPGPKKGALFHKLRHPMLTGLLVWAAAHLLVNGDVPSFILFGGLALWALVEMALINRAEPNWEQRPKGEIKKDAIFLAASVVLLIVVGLIHTYLGAATFG